MTNRRRLIITIFIMASSVALVGWLYSLLISSIHKTFWAEPWFIGLCWFYGAPLSIGLGYAYGASVFKSPSRKRESQSEYPLKEKFFFMAAGYIFISSFVHITLAPIYRYFAIDQITFTAKVDDTGQKEVLSYVIKKCGIKNNSIYESRSIRINYQGFTRSLICVEESIKRGDTVMFFATRTPVGIFIDDYKRL